MCIRDRVKDDDPRRFVAFLRDISERRKMEKQLRESEKHRAIWQLTGGLAHDFNNLLGVVIGNLDLLEEEESLEPSEEARHMIDTARSAALRGAGVARSLLAVARRQPLEFVVHDLNAVLSETLPLMQTSVGSAVRVELSLYPEPLLVNLDTEGFSNALLNVVINARDAMKDNQNARELEVRSYLAAPNSCLLYTSPSPRDATLSRMPSSA